MPETAYRIIAGVVPLIVLTIAYRATFVLASAGAGLIAGAGPLIPRRCRRRAERIRARNPCRRTEEPPCPR
jgi:hypothetical protein